MMRKLILQPMCHVVALSCALLFMQGVAQATSPLSSSGANYNMQISTSTTMHSFDDSTVPLSANRLRDFSSSNKHESSFVRNENLKLDIEVSPDSTTYNQTDGSLSVPQGETGTTGTLVGSMRDLWAGNNDGELIYLTGSTITQSGTGITLITANTPLPGAVWLGLLGLGAIGITRHRKESV